MRRTGLRAAAMLSAVLLAVGFFLPAAAAEDSVYFTAINETILPLSDSTMPFWSGGYLYVSSGTFAGGGLGIYYSPNTLKRTAVVYTYNHALIFHLDTGTVTDNQYNDYWPPAVVRGSRVFLPVSLIADYFGLTYTCSRVTHGYMIRVRSSGSILSDSTFVDAAHAQLSSRYSQYLGGGKPASGTIAVPPDTPSRGKTQEEEISETPDVKGKLIHLAFLADTERTGGLIRTLEAQGAAATIFFTEEQIRGNGDLVRQAVACGQTVGLAADAAEKARTVEEQLNAANSALFRAAALKTRLCVVLSGDGTVRKTAERAGYCCLTAEIDRGASGLRSASGAESLMNRITARRGAVTVWLADSVTGTGLKRFLTAAEKSDDGLVGLTELTA